MWEIRSLLLQPITALTSNKIKFKWAYVEQKVLNEIKRIITHNTLLPYLDFNKLFDIHKDYSDFLIVSVIIQGGKAIAFYSHELTGPQTRYTVMGK